MSKFTNINEAPIVSPEDATLISIKNGKWARCELGTLVKKNKKIDELESYIKKLEDKLESAIKVSNFKIQELMSKIDSITAGISSEVVEEAPKAKTTKKSKKAADAAA